ncbi:MAG: cell filamentation protein Fic [Deltaproteobacteria bacterium]|nr:MAG: cell filamentation protein Fic [Deltaproteobacteria bacterium]
MGSHKHISFRKEWVIDTDCAYMLGECEAYVRALRDMPLKPQYRDKLLRVSLIKGAQATTAIEGNSLSEEEIQKIDEGWSLPPSKEYLGIEVKNILSAFNTLLKDVVYNDKSKIISPDLIKDFHRMIAQNLGEHIDAIPGRFRDDNRVVGHYKAPDYKYVPELVDKMCNWLHKEFHYTKGQTFYISVVEAIAAHVYLEWIHPFADGNGRTGRLLEFYILLRAGLPSIVSHILSNFYNETRSEYYRQLNNASKERDLSKFIKYAIKGFRDGLKENLEIIQGNQFEIFWHNHIYESFANLKYTKKNAFKRKRDLILEFPINKEIDINEIQLLTPGIAKKYATLKRATLLRDLKELQNLNLIIKTGRKYLANTKILGASMPSRKI